MNTSKVTKLISAALASCVFAGFLGAQTAPSAIVNEDGNLVLNPGTAEEQIIVAPAGEVVDGNLVVGGQTIMRPEASIDSGTGDLVLGDGTRLPVPELPSSGIEARFVDTIVGIGTPATQPGQDGWYFSYNFKSIYIWGASFPNFVFLERLGSIVYVPDSGPVITDGMWVHAFGFPTAGNNSWVFLRSAPNFLRDVRTLDGPSQSQKRINDSLVYIQNPAGAGAAGWYAFLENSARTATFIAPAGSSSFTQVWPRQ